MVNDLKCWGYWDILKLVWFCYEGVDGEPCGICENCRKKISDGLGFMFPTNAIKRLLIYKYVYEFHPMDGILYYAKYLGLSQKIIASSDNIYTGSAFRMPYSVTYEEKYFSWFRKLEKLSVKQLKKLLFRGSHKYGYRPTSYDALSNLKSNHKRKEQLALKFNNIFHGIDEVH